MKKAICTIGMLALAAAVFAADRKLEDGLYAEMETSKGTILLKLEFENERILTMLYTIAVVLLILWLLGLVSSYTIGGLIHILLVIAIVMILVNIIGGRRSL